MNISEKIDALQSQIKDALGYCSKDELDEIADALIDMGYQVPLRQAAIEGNKIDVVYEHFK